MGKFDSKAPGQKKSQCDLHPAAKAPKPAKKTKTAADWGAKENKVISDALKAGKIDENTTVKTLKLTYPPFEEKCHQHFQYGFLQNKLKKAKKSLTEEEGKLLFVVCRS